VELADVVSEDVVLGRKLGDLVSVDLGPLEVLDALVLEQVVLYFGSRV